MKIDVKPSTSASRSTAYKPKAPQKTPNPPAPQPDQEQIERLKTLSKRLAETAPSNVANRKPAGAIYSNLFFRALLLSAIALMAVTMLRQPEPPAVEDAGLEISTSETATRSESKQGTDVDSPPPAVLVQPSE